MSPLKPVTIQTRRGIVAVAMLALIALPAASWIASGRVNDTAVLAEEIQRQRVEAIRSNCQAQNRRHDETIRTLDALLVKRVRTAKPRERTRLRASRESTVALISALAPKRDCARVVAESAPPPAKQ